MRRHHRSHHDTEILMTHNMNFTLPLADWWFDTYRAHGPTPSAPNANEPEARSR